MSSSYSLWSFSFRTMVDKLRPCATHVICNRSRNPHCTSVAEGPVINSLLTDSKPIMQGVFQLIISYPSSPTLASIVVKCVNYILIDPLAAINVTPFDYNLFVFIQTEWKITSTLIGKESLFTDFLKITCFRDIIAGTDIASDKQTALYCDVIWFQIHLRVGTWDMCNSICNYKTLNLLYSKKSIFLIKK